MGALYSVLEQSFPPRPTWSVNDIPDLTGKVILVTGAFSDINICACVCMLNVFLFVGGNAGVGKETVKVSIQPPLPNTRAHRYPATPYAQREGLPRGTQRPKGERGDSRAGE